MANLLVLGNPGTGKTSYLVKLINDFIEKGHKPSDITILSHTRVAAREIASRSSSKGVNASTIHSMAYRMADVAKEQVVTPREVRKFSDGIGIPMKMGFNADSDNQLEVGDEYLSVLSYAEACCMPYQWAYEAKGRPGTLDNFEYFYLSYKQWKSDYGLIDFNDMINLALKADECPTLPILLIDEAQDLSKQQWRLIDQLSEHSEEMVVTGDPDQALFTWGGAEPKLMLDWAKDTKAKINELSQSYRVPARPHSLSISIIEHVKNRYEKSYLPTERSGSVERFLSVTHYDFVNLDSALILYRNHALRKEIEQQLILHNKAYKTLSGFASPCCNKYGKGVQAWINIQNSEFPDKKDIARVKAIATFPLIKAINNDDLEAIKTMKGAMALDIPYEMYRYYQYVNIPDADKIVLSTIHGAKGMEHDLVILVNGTTQRVLETAVSNPDPEYQVWYVAVTRTKDRLHIIDAENPIL